MKQLSAAQIEELFKNAPNKKTYKKKGVVLMRPAVEGEVIVTELNGAKETEKTLGKDDVVLKNLDSHGEEYSPGKEHFEKNYEVTGEKQGKWMKAKAKGKVTGFEYKGEPITFTAPWNEEMVCNEGDFLVSPVGGKHTDIYRIEKDAFGKTYK